jgi:chromosome partitioning protein
MGHIYIFSNHKGGTSKSTSVLNVGAGLVLKNKKVLLIDIDPQQNLTSMLGIFHRPEITTYELFTGDGSIEESILNIKDKLDLIPSSLDVSGVELEIANRVGRETILKRSIDQVKDRYDFILLDAPPSMSLITINGLIASEKVFIPVLSEFNSLLGLKSFAEVVGKVKGLNPNLDIGGVILSRYDKRKVLNRTVLDQIEEVFGDKLLKTVIRDNIAVAESPSLGQDIFTYAPKSYGAEDYLALTNEILKLSRV